MNYTTTWNNFPYMIGWDTFFPKLEAMSKVNATSFPPYNVRKVDDDNFIIELAVAGYNKSCLTITEENGNLTVVGELPETTDEYLHKGIAGRKFTRTFSLAEHMLSDGVQLIDGMLYIKVTRIIPEEKKPKTLEIDDFKNSRRYLEDEKIKKYSNKKSGS